VTFDFSNIATGCVRVSERPIARSTLKSFE